MTPSLPIRPELELSVQAIKELEVALTKTIGKEALEQLSKEEVNHIGCLLLTLTATRLKIQLREKAKI